MEEILWATAVEAVAAEILAVITIVAVIHHEIIQLVVSIIARLVTRVLTIQLVAIIIVTLVIIAQIRQVDLIIVAEASSYKLSFDYIFLLKLISASACLTRRCFLLYREKCC